MLKSIHRYIRLISVLACFTISTLSPVSFVIFPDSSAFANAPDQTKRHIRINIVLVHDILSSLTKTEPDDLNGDGIPDGTSVLVDKRDAVVRPHIRIKPLSRAVIEPLVYSDPFPKSPYEFEILKDRRHKETEGYLFRSTGLSPPAVFS